MSDEDEGSWRGSCWSLPASQPEPRNVTMAPPVIMLVLERGGSGESAAVEVDLATAPLDVGSVTPAGYHVVQEYCSVQQPPNYGQQPPNYGQQQPNYGQQAQYAQFAAPVVMNAVPVSNGASIQAPPAYNEKSGFA